MYTGFHGVVRVLLDNNAAVNLQNYEVGKRSLQGLGWGSYLANLTFISTDFQYISSTSLGWGSFQLPQPRPWLPCRDYMYITTSTCITTCMYMMYTVSYRRRLG